MRPQHGRPEKPSVAPAVPEPAHAERARTLVHLGRVGALSTLSHRSPGWPFGSVMPYCPDPSGRPLFLISSLAVHAQNLRADARASLLVTQPGSHAEPLSASRVTLLGRTLLLGPEETSAARSAYLARHANAAHWANFRDFSFYRLEITEAYYVGGFGVMGWITGEEYRGAAPDPLAEAAEGILASVNRRQTGLRRFYRKARGSRPDEAIVTSVDRLGFRLRVRVGNRLQGVRFPFPREARSPQDAKALLAVLLK